MFQDRTDAGQKLAEELLKLRLAHPVVLALPRGGVPVAAVVADVLQAPLDIVIVRKVGAPGNRELAVAAIIDGSPTDVVVNREIAEAYDLDDAALRTLVSQERPELERRRNAYLRGRSPVPAAGRTVVLVDDGAATGTTMKLAIRAIRRRAPQEIIVALPVAPPDVVAELGQEADRIVCLSTPARFQALSYHYHDFSQTSDDEVIGLLDQHSPGRAVFSANPSSPPGRS